MKKALVFLCTMAIILATTLVPMTASAKTLTLQAWDFSGMTIPTENKDTKVFNQKGDAAIGFSGYWDYQTKVSQLSENNGTASFNVNGSIYDGKTSHRVSFKLDETLKAGKTYSFSVNFYSPEGKWIESPTVWYQAAAASGAGPGDTLCTGTLVASGTASSLSTNTQNMLSYVIEPSEDIPAQSFLCFGFKSAYQNSGTYCIGGASISTQVPELDEDGNIALQKWTNAGMTLPDNYLTADKGDYNFYSTDGNTYTLVQKYWDNVYKTKRSFENNVCTITTLNAPATAGTSTDYKTMVHFAYKLNVNLEAGKKYMVSANIYSPTSSWVDGNKILMSYDANKTCNQWNAPLKNDSATELATINPGALSSDTAAVQNFTFTPSTDLAAGGYIHIAFKAAYQADSTYCIGDVSLAMDNATLMAEYDFGYEDIRSAISTNSTETYTAAEGTTKAGDVALKKYQYTLNITLPTETTDDYDGLKLESNTEYKLSMTVAVMWGGGTVSVYAVKPKEIEWHKGCLISENIGAVTAKDGGYPSTGEYVFTTAGTDIDYSQYSALCVVVDPNDDASSSLVYEMSLSKSIKAIAPTPGVPELEKRYYKTLRLSQKPFAVYSLKNPDGSFTEISGNVLNGLESDTQYTVCVRYNDTGRYYPSAISDEVTFKTLKFADVNADDAVNVKDFVRIKKANAQGYSEDDLELYDLDANGKFDAFDLIEMRTLLLKQ